MGHTLIVNISEDWAAPLLTRPCADCGDGRKPKQWRGGGVRCANVLDCKGATEGDKEVARIMAMDDEGLAQYHRDSQAETDRAMALEYAGEEWFERARAERKQPASKGATNGN